LLYQLIKKLKQITMKKSLILAAVLLATGSFFIVSCKSNDSDTSLKSPKALNTAINQQKENVENNPIAKTVSLTNTFAKFESGNLQAAFKGETIASAKYAAYSKKAEQEGLHKIALLFKAASTAENIHANNHKAVLKESGISVPVIEPQYSVGTTRENLEDAIKGETYEVTTMYPQFLTVANEAGDQMALISLNYAYKTEKKHKVMYETALAALNNNTANTLPAVYYVCATCGNTYQTTAPARCGISMTKSGRFIKITTL